MVVLVTGGAGYVGSHTCVELLQGGHTVVVVDNFSNSSPRAIAAVEKLTDCKIRLYRGDVRNVALLEKIFSQNSVDWVMHFAGLKAVGESCRKPLEYYQNNVGGMLALTDVMRKHGCNKIVFSSSATVYGEPERLPLDENCSVGNVTNPYGASKYFQEVILQDICKADSAWTAVLLRYFNPIGAHPSGLLGEDPQGIPNNLTPYVAKVARGELPFVPVFGNDYNTVDGTSVRDYLHVCDLAKGHVAALNHVNTAGAHVYNLGTGKGCSVLQVIDAFQRACGKTIPIEFKPRRSGDVAALYADVSKARRELHWTAELSLEDMCKSLWNWQLHN